MSGSAGIQILAFDSFGALETHLRILKAKYNDMIKNYEETLGFILRDTRPSTVKNQQLQQKWSEEMQQALNAKEESKPGMQKKDEGKKMFGASKGKGDPSMGEWVSLEPMSVFVGPKNKGMAEIYFDSINLLRENVGKINLALSICGAVKAKAAMSGNTSLLVSFVNDIPTKVVLRSSEETMSKKYAMSFTFAVPSVPAKAHGYN
jgi:regulator of replication initiation timing